MRDPRPRTTPPECAEHADADHSVIRFGRYGRSTPQPRQRYQCRRKKLDKNGQSVLDDDGRPELIKHVFTPPLPRAHVHPAEGGCAECEELRGHHHGETAVARRHTWPTRLVARGLLELSLGGSYADVSRWALRMAQADADRFAELVADGMSEAEAARWVEAEATAADAAAAAAAPAPSEAAPRPLRRPARVRVKGRRPRKSRAKKPPTTAAPSATGDEPAADAGEPKTKTKNPRTADSTNVWHIAADWCEAFAPVVFEDVEGRLRAQAAEETARLDPQRAVGGPLDRPQVLLLDDIPVYGRNRATGGVARRDDGFFLLVAGEVTWGAPPPDPMTRPDRSLRLRVVRAMPKSNAPAWRLLLDELGYAPDFVVADAGTGIARAVESHYDPSRTTFVPSLWHVGRAVRTGLADTRGAFVTGPTGKALRPELAEQLAALSRAEALTDLAAWSGWWDELEARCVHLGLPLDKVRRRRRNYEEPFAAAIPRLRLHPEVPVSTGGLETVMAKRVEPLLALRRTAFANIERTNRLFDLVVAREHGAFDDIGHIVALLREDASRAVGQRTGTAGWTTPLRAIADPRPEDGRYSSLRDALLILDLAESRGLA
ncbi:MAG: hypothetical protein ACXVYC_14000 [Blastococcus sp.]